MTMLGRDLAVRPEVPPMMSRDLLSILLPASLLILALVVGRVSGRIHRSYLRHKGTGQVPRWLLDAEAIRRYAADEPLSADLLQPEHVGSARP
jgi:hypothetical protein